MRNEFKDIRKILVIKLRHIGDVLLTVPAIRGVRETFPSAYIAALVNKGTEEVIAGNPLLDEVIAFDRGILALPFYKRFVEEIAFVKKIREKGFDMTIDLTSGDRGAIISLASGARYRLGMDFKKGFIGKKYMYTHLARSDERIRHTLLKNLDVVRGFGISAKNLSVDFYTSEDDKAFVREIFKINHIEEDDVIVHVHPTSRWLFKCWKDEYMAEVIGWLLDGGIVVIVTSSPDKKEVEKAKKILSLVGSRITHHPRYKYSGGGASRLIDLCGRTTIQQLGAISEASDLFFGVDSAPMHIAAAVGTPVIALFGPSGAFDWGPWDNEYSQESEATPYKKKNGIQTFGRHTVIQKDWECIPCGEDGCEGSKISKCLIDISADEVKGLIARYLKDL